ncbi:MAG: hypothetical protein N2Z74_01025 [Syntrophales bacterium]|nr:hypothetical protein [Syntrophales bacterium]
MKRITIYLVMLIICASAVSGKPGHAWAAEKTAQFKIKGCLT